MFDLLNQPPRFTAFFTSARVGKTGLAPTVDLYRDGASVLTNGATSEVNGGLYAFTPTAAQVATAGLYVAIFKTSDTTVDQQHLPDPRWVGKSWVQNMDAPISGVAASVWSAGTRTLSSFGTLAADVWAATTRSITDKAGFSLSTAPPTAAQIRTEIDNNSTKLDATITSRSSHSALDVWLVSLGAAFLPNTLGQKLKNWVLGSDNRALLSADVHTSGATVAAVTNKAGFAPSPAQIRQEIDVNSTQLQRLLGLQQENGVFDDTIYDGKKLVSATIYVYDSKVNAVMHDKATGLKFKYSIAQSYDPASGLRETASVLREQ